MPRAVQRRPHQIGHAGVDDHEPSAAGPALQIDDPRQRGRRPGRRASGQARAAGRARRSRTARQDRGRVRRPATRGLCRAGTAMPRPPPRSRCSSGDAVREQLAREAGNERRRRARSGSVRRHLRSDVHVQADERAASACCADVANHVARLVERHAELRRRATRWRCADGCRRPRRD